MAKSLQDYLVSGDSMARLSAHAGRLLQFQRLLEAALPEALRPYARVANFRLGKIFIHANNGAIAAKIRQLGPRIISELSTQAVEITQIEVRVQAPVFSAAPPHHERPTLPGYEQKQGLTLLTQSLPYESNLRLALERLLQAVKE